MNRRVRNLIFSFMPFVLLNVYQIIGSIVASQIGVALYIHNYHGNDFATFVEGMTSGSTMTIINNGTYLIYCVIGLSTFGYYYYSHFYKKNHRRYDHSTVFTKAAEPNVSFRGYRPLWVIAGMAIAILGISIVVNNVVEALSVAFPEWLAEFEALEEAAGLTDINAIMLIYACIFGPIVEELGFRGICIEHLKRSTGFWGTCIIQAILFGAVHMNKMQASYAFLVGMLLGYVYLKTGNLVLTSMMHMIYNFCGGMVEYGMEGIPQTPVITFVILVVGLGASYYGAKILAKSKNRVKEN